MVPSHSPAPSLLTPSLLLTQEHSSLLAADEVLTVQRVLKTKGKNFSNEQVGMGGGGAGKEQGERREGWATPRYATGQCSLWCVCWL